MIDGIRLHQEQSAKTALGWGTASAQNFYFVSGYSIESLLADEERFNKDVKRCMQHMMTAAKDDTIYGDEITMYSTTPENATGTALIKISTDYKGVFYVDFEKPDREKIYTDRKQALELLKTKYRQVLCEAGRPQ